MALKETVDLAFRRLAAGELGDESPVQEGWETPLPSGRVVARSTLQRAAESLIALGPEAVPHLLPRVMADNAALRYVAVYALEQITGERPSLPHFDAANRSDDHIRAIETWRKWYEARKRSGKHA